MMDRHVSWELGDTYPVLTAAAPAAEEAAPVHDTPEPSANEDTVYGTWLDDCLHLRGNGGTSVYIAVHQALREHLTELRRLPRRADHVANLEKLLGCVLANAVRARFFREADLVAYMRRDSFYVGRQSWLSGGALARVVDDLINLGYLCGSTGKSGVRSSTFAASHKLASLAEHSGAGPESVGRTPPATHELVILRAPKLRRRGGKRVQFVATGETEEWAANLSSYNEFIDTFELALDLSPEGLGEYVDGVNGKRSPHNREPKLIQPELFARHLCRIFNDGDFASGGRLYRGWWITTPKHLRKEIRIGGETVTELDYAGFVARSLYHQHGIDYVEDPYDLPELSSYGVEQAQDPSYYRNSLKKLLIALLNGAEPDAQPERIALERSFLPRFTRSEVEQLLAGKHPLLATLFRTGVGKKNQRLDSDIALTVITNLRLAGIPCLPVHDSFIVPTSAASQLASEMDTVYYAKLGFHPVISEVD